MKTCVRCKLPKPVEVIGPATPLLTTEFKQFLFFMTLPENKQRVYAEVKRGLSIIERNILIQLNRRSETAQKIVA